jgi:nucleoside-diphosphate kinase
VTPEVVEHQLNPRYTLIERTFVMIKPDAVGRRLCGEIIRRYESKGLKLVALKMQIVSWELAARHYAEHEGKPFYDGLMQFITSGPSIQMVWEGESAIEAVRKINGATNCLKADVGTIRGDLGLTTRFNIVHASDGPETAAREIAVYFSDNELWDYALPDAQWLVG